LAHGHQNLAHALAGAVHITLCLLVSKGWDDQEVHDETQSDPNGNFEEPIDHQVFLALVITGQYENRCCHNGHAFVTDPIQPCGKDRKSTRLNSSHVSFSYAVFCLNNII